MTDTSYEAMPTYKAMPIGNSTQYPKTRMTAAILG
jgi:hypothetical protein